MFDPPDYSVIEGTEAAYRGFYPEPRATVAPPGALDVSVPVAEGVSLGCRFFEGAPDGANLLYFHGNGEVASDYDDIARLFTQLGINLLVGEYRGYGFSTGTPSFPTMLSDAHLVLTGFQDLLKERGNEGPLFLMGRSMGGHSAVELAAHHPAELAGLILESTAPRATRYLESLDEPTARELERRHLEKVRAIAIPVLALHGERDELIPCPARWSSSKRSRCRISGWKLSPARATMTSCGRGPSNIWRRCALLSPE